MPDDVQADLFGRSFLTLRDFSAAEIEHLLHLAARLKIEKREHREVRRLDGRNIALIFEKDSTRTRIGFEVAAYDQGAHVTYLGPTGSHIGKKESVKDTARVLGRVYDAIEFRGFHQADVEALARFSGVPVYNGLTDEDHPTQVLADLLTIREHVAKPLGEVALAYVGDARGNMGDELLIGAATMGMDLRIVAPQPGLAARRLPEARPGPRRDERRPDHRHRRHRGGRPRRGRRLHGRVGLDGRARGHLGRADRAAAAVPGGRRDDGRDRQPGREVHALPAGLPRPRDRDGPEDVRAPRPDGDGGHGRGVRVAGVDRLRPGREPDAHDQGRAGRHARAATAHADARRGGARRQRAPAARPADDGREPAGERGGRRARPAADRARARPRPHPRQRAAGGAPRRSRTRPTGRTRSTRSTSSTPRPRG